MNRLKGILRLVFPTIGVLAIVAFAFVTGPTGRGAAVAAADAPANASSAATGLSSAVVAHENPVLGYRITLPSAYRRSGTTLAGGQSELLGSDTYTFLTENEEHAPCLQDGGGVPPAAMSAYLHIDVYRNGAAAAALDWAKSRRATARGTWQPATVDGRDAARFVEDGAASQYVMRANGRIYVLFPTLSGAAHPIDQIAASFQAITPGPLSPPATASAQSRRIAARALAEALARAFGARDAEAVARLMPNCWITVWDLVDDAPTGAVLRRSVTLFTDALRDRFATGDLTVSIDPAVQVQLEGGREKYVVRSEWNQRGRTTRVDLFLDEVEGGWHWVAGQLHFARGDLIKGCLSYGSPWDSGGTC
jgi:hypothetical protein